MVQNLYKLGRINISIHQGAKYFNIPHLYTTDANFYSSSINIGSISFFASSDTHQSHHLLRCHAAGINSSLISFLSALHFSNLVCLLKNLF